MIINEITFDEINDLDLFNSNNSHSYEEDDSWNYNCMAYAFGAFEWLCPLNMDFESPEAVIEELGLNENNKVLYKKIKKALDCYHYNNHFLRKLSIQRMLKTFPDLRVISSFDDLKDNEYGISFATGEDDFHFVRYDEGIFSHKAGARDIAPLSSEEEGFLPRYNSKVIRFAMKKGPVNFNGIF